MSAPGVAAWSPLVCVTPEATVGCHSGLFGYEVWNKEIFLTKGWQWKFLAKMRDSRSACLLTSLNLGDRAGEQGVRCYSLPITRERGHSANSDANYSPSLSKEARPITHALVLIIYFIPVLWEKNRLKQMRAAGHWKPLDTLEQIGIRKYKDNLWIKGYESRFPNKGVIMWAVKEGLEL